MYTVFSHYNRRRILKSSFVCIRMMSSVGSEDIGWAKKFVGKHM
jgi:hypothetical protein